MRTWKCAAVTCNCGIAAREGNDVIVVDMCRDGIPRARFASKQKPAEGTSIRRDPNGKSFKVFVVFQSMTIQLLPLVTHFLKSRFLNQKELHQQLCERTINNQKFLGDILKLTCFYELFCGAQPSTVTSSRGRRGEVGCSQFKSFNMLFDLKILSLVVVWSATNSF